MNVMNIRPTKCLICEQPTKGYHYNVASCKACKTFFRRMCILNLKAECIRNKDCFDFSKHDKPQRCRACRYQKCVETGMDPTTLGLDYENANTNYRRSMKRRKKETDEVNTAVIRTVETVENRLQKTIDMLMNLEKKLDDFRMSAYNPTFENTVGLEYFVESEHRLSFADKYGPMPGWPLNTTSLYPHNLPNSQIRCLQNNRPTYEPTKKRWQFFNILTVIEYAKTFEFFNLLVKKDKLTLLKHTSLACMNLQISYFSVERKYATTIQPNGCKDPLEDELHYNVVVMSVGPLIRYEVSKIEYCLIKSITLCNPAIPDLSKHAQRVLSNQRQKFAEALFDHCLRNRKEGPDHFTKLIFIIDLLERQQRMQKDLHLLYIAPILSKFPKDFIINVYDDILDS